MKNKSLVIVVALFVAVASLALPVSSYAGHHGGGWGWGAFAGGLLLGTALTAPWYYAPRPVYVYPPPPVVYTYPAPAPAVYAPSQAYAYPDPAYSRYSQPPAPAPAYNQAPAASQSSQVAGQWIQVPGQWVGDRWVPPHRAWAPTN